MRAEFVSCCGSILNGSDSLNGVHNKAQGLGMIGGVLSFIRGSMPNWLYNARTPMYTIILHGPFPVL